MAGKDMTPLGERVAAVELGHPFGCSILGPFFIIFYFTLGQETNLRQKGNF